MRRINSTVLLFLVIVLVSSSFCATAEFKSIVKGAKGDDVSEIQQYLLDMGLLTGKVDGDFGNGTEKAVRTFQQQNGLEETGVVDEATYNLLAGIIPEEDLIQVDPELFQRVTLDSSDVNIAAVLEDGRVVTQYFDIYKPGNESTWENIVSVACGYGSTVGLKENGTVTATGNNNYGQCNVKGWMGITDIAAGNLHTVGLRTDGTVVATGCNDQGQCNVSSWTDIVNVACGGFTTYGIRSDGTCVAAGDNEFGQCNIQDWTDIVDIDGGDWFTVGLKSNGTVVHTGGFNSDDKGSLRKIQTWNDVTAIFASGSVDAFGLKENGEVVDIAGRNLPDKDKGALAVAFCGWNFASAIIRSDGVLCTKDEATNGLKAAIPSVMRPASTEAPEETAPAEPEDTGIWMIKAYVDEFDLPTDDYFIVNNVPLKGHFSNTATNNSDLTAYVFCEKIDNNYVSNLEYIVIRLFEYNDYRVNNIFSDSQYYNVTVMDKDGVKYNLAGVIYGKDSDININGDDAQKVIRALKKGGTVYFSIREDLTKYVFSIENADGFAAAYTQWYLEN